MVFENWTRFSVDDNHHLLEFHRRIYIFADCCDGSDEYEGKTRCPNTCIMGGNLQYKPKNYMARTSRMVDIESSKSTINNPEHMIQKLTGAWPNFLLETREEKLENFSKLMLTPCVVASGLKLVIILQVILVSCLLIICVSRRRARSKRRRVWWVEAPVLNRHR